MSHRTSTPLLALGLMLAAAIPAAAQERRSLPLAEIAPAVTRQDTIRGLYEALDVPELGALVVASTPSFDKGTPGYLDLLDAEDLSPIRRIELPRRAFALAMNHAAGRIYVGNTLDGSIGVVDAASGLVLDTVQLGQPDGEGFEHVRMIEVDEQSGRVFVSSPSDTGTAWIIDTAAGNAVQRIDDVGLWSAGLAHDAAKGRVYVSGGGVEEIAVLDARSGERVAAFTTGDTTEATKEGSKHFFVNLALDAEGGRLFAADGNSGQLYVFDTESGEVVATVPVGAGTLDVLFSAQTRQVFATYRGVTREAPEGTGGMVVIDADDYTDVVDIPLYAHPNSLELGADGKALYLTVKATHEESHPGYVKDGADSVLRFDLEKLSGIAG